MVGEMEVIQIELQLNAGSQGRGWGSSLESESVESHRDVSGYRGSSLEGNSLGGLGECRGGQSALEGAEGRV